MNHEKISQNTESAPKSKKDLKTIAKKALFGITAAATIGAASGCAETTPKPADRQQYMEAVDKYIAHKQQLDVVYTEDGTTISFVEGGDTRYSLKDTDNDTVIILCRLTDQALMTFMKITHGRDQADSEAFPAPCSNDFADFCLSIYGFHLWTSFLVQLLDDFIGDLVAMLRSGESAGLNISNIGFESFFHG